MDESMLLEAKPEGSLMYFTRALIERGDFNKLGPEAVTILLAINHYYGENHGDDENDFPSIEYLSDLTGLDNRAVDHSLETLFRNSYLNRESYWSDGESKTLYKIRERHWLYDQDGEVTGEVSWDKQLPSSLFGINEFQNILATKNAGDAKYIHIEKLQVNIGSPFDEPLKGSPAIKDREAKLESQTSGSTSTDTSKLSLAADNDEELPLNQANDEPSSLVKLHQQYTDRLYREFASALESIEKEAESAFREKISHEHKKPQQPVGLSLLVNSRRWQSNLTDWKSNQEKLDQHYDNCLQERQRLLEAMKPSAEGSDPVYIQEAIAQLKQDYPHFTEALDRKYSSIA